jgi:HEAT repeat protein
MRLAVLSVLLLLPVGARAQMKPATEPSGLPEEQAVKAAHIPETGPGLVEFFRKRAQRTAEPGTIKELIGQLGDKDAAVRDKAFGGLVQLGMAAVPLLRQAANSVDAVETSTRAKECLKYIEGDESANLVTSVARLLAQKNAEGAVEALLDYLAVAENAKVYQDVEASLVEASSPDGKLHPALLKALKDQQPARRATAAAVVCQAGDSADRAAVKPLLKDPRPVVRLRAALGLARRSEGAAIPVLIDLLGELPEELRHQGEEFLTELAGEWKVEVPEGKTPLLQKMRREVWSAWWKAAEGKALLEEFKQRTLSNDERDRVLGLIRDLGNEDNKEREKALLALIKVGPRTLPLLRRAVQEGNTRVGEGARQATQQLEKQGLPMLPSVAARLLALHRTEGAGEALLAYVPFIDSDELLAAVQQALPDLAAQEGKVDPAFVKALTDAVPARRLAAAEALASQPGQREAVKKLLADKEPEVRLRTALALAKAGEKEAVPALINMLPDVPADLTWQGEEYLSRLAGDKKPQAALGKDDTAKQKYREAWAAWWKENTGKINIIERSGSRRVLGYTFIVEQYNPMTGTGRVSELDAAGKTRWEIRNLNTPMDAKVVGDRVLIAEAGGNRVSERDTKGNSKWDFQVPNQPVACEWVRNGNIFIVHRNGLIEVDREKREVIKIQRPDYIMHGAKLADGTFGFVNNQFQYIRLDRTGKEIKSIMLPRDPTGHQPYPTVLPNGNVVLAHHGAGKVLEIDREGKTLREVKANQPWISTLVPGGNVLVSYLNARKVQELDWKGRVVKEFSDNIQPYKAERR